MNGYERTVAMLERRLTDCLPLMPITMMFATDVIGVPYGRYATDYRLLVEGQLAVAEKFDVDQVSAISDPAREATDLGAEVHFYDDQPPAQSADEAKNPLFIGKIANTGERDVHKPRCGRVPHAPKADFAFFLPPCPLPRGGRNA